MSGMKKIGNWSGVREITSSLQSDLTNACNVSAKQFGLIAEGIAKEHISKQDLPWAPLSEDYVEQKKKKGLSENILVATSSYFQSITSWAEGMNGYAGVKKKVYNEDGEEISDIAKTHEYGTSIAGRNKNVTIPARPLWQPTIKEAFFKWQKVATPVHIYKKKHRL
jgi:hypothetical protein